MTLKLSAALMLTAAAIGAARNGHAQGIVRTIAGGRPPVGEALKQVFSPASVATDNAGNYYIGDYNTASIYEASQDGEIRRVAGSGIAGFSGDNGPATSAKLGAALGIAVDRAGNLFVADTSNNRIRRVDARTHIITTIAGNGTSGWGGDGGPATAAELSGPNGVAEFNGQVFIADSGNCAIREVAVTGRISTVAGSGTHCGFGGDGGPAANAQLNLPEGVTADASGNLFIADYFNQRVRRVDHATAIISTVAGNGTAGFSGDGGPATGAEINGPVAAAIDSFGNLYVADNGNQRVRRVDHATAIISTVAGNGTAGFSGDGGPAVKAEIAVPSSVAVDRAGDVLVADIGNGRIRRVDAATHAIGTVAGGGNGGDGGPAMEAEVGVSAAFVNGLALDPFGDVLVTDNDNNRIERERRE
jgi:sugar lactone lactonase YvrE